MNNANSGADRRCHCATVAEHRAVILMKETEDMQYHEIAEALGCSIGTVMSRLFYARKKLQNYCEIFMKTFEEKWTAWLDGELSGMSSLNLKLRCRTERPRKRRSATHTSSAPS